MRMIGAKFKSSSPDSLYIQNDWTAPSQTALQSPYLVISQDGIEEEPSRQTPPWMSRPALRWKASLLSYFIPPEVLLKSDLLFYSENVRSRDVLRDLDAHLAQATIRYRKPFLGHEIAMYSWALLITKHSWPMGKYLSSLETWQVCFSARSVCGSLISPFEMGITNSPTGQVCLPVCETSPIHSIT